MKTRSFYLGVHIWGLLMLLPLFTMAQPGPMGQQRHERVEAERIAFITRQLNLTPAEAKVFWPLYNEHDAKRDEILKKLRTRNRDLMEGEFDGLSDEEALKMADAQIVEEQMLLDLRKEYHAKYKTVLPPVKILKLYQAEREFKRVLIQKIRGPKRP